MSALDRFPAYPDNHRDYSFPVAVLTRHEELEVSLSVVERVIQQAEQDPDLFSAGFLDRQKERLEEIKVELELCK